MHPAPPNMENDDIYLEIGPCQTVWPDMTKFN